MNDRHGQLMTCHNCGSDEHLVARCPQEGQGKGGPPSMVNFLSTGAVDQNGSGGLSAEASASSTLPPWQQEELL